MDDEKGSSGMPSERNMLIVDDSKLARLMIVRVIEMYRPRWKMIEAHNAEDATLKASEMDIDLITLDMNMPGQDGLAFAPALRLMHPEATIALLTANIQPAVQERAKLLGLNFIPKPITPQKLLEYLAEISM